MTAHRRRRCEDCGKPLGATVARCYDCGGDDPSASREERLADSRKWKLLGGIDPETVEEAHSTEE